MSRLELLPHVLDRLLPAVDELGGAGELGLAARLNDDPLLIAAPGSIGTVLDALPDGYSTLEPAAQSEALRQIERQEPEAFAILISAAYNAYYVDARVLARIERRTAYKAGAPQPGGYDIEPFDESILAQIAERDPLWREVES
jgi:hypothetical protein